MKIALLIILTIIFCFYCYMRFSATHDKISRSQWAFECFVTSFERYEATKDERAKAEFYANAMLFYAYETDLLDILSIKELVENNKDEEAKKEMLNLIKLCSKHYRLNRI